MTKVEFVGIPSGDYESFVFAVDKETFIRVLGRKPMSHEKSPFYKGKYMLYPDHVFTRETEENGDVKPIKVSIEVSEVK